MTYYTNVSGSSAHILLFFLPPAAMPRDRAGAGAARQVLAALKAERRSNLAAIFPSSPANTGRAQGDDVTDQLASLRSMNTNKHVFCMYSFCIMYGIICKTIEIQYNLSELFDLKETKSRAVGVLRHGKVFNRWPDLL